MATDSRSTMLRSGRTTRLVYLAALVFFVGPFIVDGTRSFNAVSAGPSVEKLGVSYLLLLYVAVFFLVLLRAFWVVSGRTQLDSPSNSFIASVLRNAGIAFMYFGVFGYVLFLSFLAVKSAPAIFVMFALPLKTMTSYGLLFFETGRILAFESRSNTPPLDLTR